MAHLNCRTLIIKFEAAMRRGEKTSRSRGHVAETNVQTACPTHRDMCPSGTQPAYQSLDPVSQAGCEKVEKMHFVDFDLDFLPKQKGPRDCFGI